MMTKVFGPNFVVLSFVTSLTKQLIGVHKLFWHLLWNSWEHFCGPKRLLKTQTFEKRQHFQWKKHCALFFLVFIQCDKPTNLTGHFVWNHKLFRPFLCKLWENFLGPMKLLKTQVFWKKKPSFQRKKKIVVYFFSYYRVWQTSRDNLYGSNRFSDNHCGFYKSIFLST